MRAGRTAATGSIALLLAVSNPAMRAGPPAADGRGDAPSLFLGLGVHFEPNRGQLDAQVRFRARVGGQTAFFTDTGPVFALPSAGRGQPHGRAGAAIRMELEGGTWSPPDATGRLPGVLNYFIGDRTDWRPGIPTFAGVRYRNVYRGIDLAFRGEGATLEHRFVVSPGIDPGRIRMAFPGASGLRLDPAGNLLIDTPAGPVRHTAPLLFQRVAGTTVPVDGTFRLLGDRVGFAVGSHDPTHPLVIDPQWELAYATYLGGAQADSGTGIAVDASGDAYVTGATSSAAFPTTTGALDTVLGGTDDAFVAKIGSDGALVYSTYLGGGAIDQGLAIAVDASGNAYVTGRTKSTDFPATDGAFDTTLGGTGGNEDAFMAKVGPSGSTLPYATYLGGDMRDEGLGIALDGSGSVLLAGVTEENEISPAGFPTTAGAYDTSHNGLFDAFLVKLVLTGNGVADLAYGTFVGGGEHDRALGISLDGSGGIYLTGRVDSTDFPTTAGAYDITHNGGPDVFVARIVPAGPASTHLVYSTFLGGADEDIGYGIAVDGAGRAFVAGTTEGEGFPATPGAFDETHNGLADAFVAGIDPAGNEGSDLAYATFLGGESIEHVGGIALDGSGSLYVTGGTGSGDFPTPGGFDITITGGIPLDAFIATLAPDGAGADDLSFATFLGGDSLDQGAAIAVSEDGDAYVAGHTTSDDFPTPGGFDTSHNGASDAFVAVLEFAADPAYQPDGWISLARAKGYVGDDVHNETGKKQTRSVRVPRGKAKTFFIRAENDGDETDTFRVRGCKGGGGFGIAYLAGAKGTSNITKKVVNGTYRLANVAPGALRIFRLTIKVGAPVKVGKTKVCKVLLTSMGDGDQKDAVKARVTARR